MPRTFPRSNETPQIVASPTRADTRTGTMRRPNDAAHPQGCTLGWYAALLQSAPIPTVRVPHPSPPSNPQGCTLGWYALPLWGKWNPVLMAAQPRRLLEGDCGMARSFTRSSPNGATCINPGQRSGIHATHRPNPQTGASPYPPLNPQGCTLGWYALPLWGKPNPVLMAAQPRRLLEGDCGMARSFARSSPNGATCVNPGQRPGKGDMYQPRATPWDSCHAPNPPPPTPTPLPPPSAPLPTRRPNPRDGR